MDSLSALLVRATAISHATESDEKVSKAILGLCPDGYPERIDVSRVKGHYGNEIRVLRMRIKGRAKAERFLHALWVRLSDQDRKKLLDELLARPWLSRSSGDCAPSRALAGKPRIQVYFSGHCLLTSH